MGWGDIFTKKDKGIEKFPLVKLFFNKIVNQ